METVADLLAHVEDREDTAFSAAERTAPMTTGEAVASARQIGNLFRHYGVRPGARVAVVSGPPHPTSDAEPGVVGESPVPVLAILGALAAGGLVDLDPPGAVDAAILVVPAAWRDRYQTGPGTTARAYGVAPDPPDVAHLEREAWSENPTAPPVDLDARTDALADDRVYANGDLLALARGVVVEEALADVETVSLAAPLTDAGTLVAGVLAPLSAGATVLVDGSEAEVAVTREGTAGGRRIDPASVTGQNT